MEWKVFRDTIAAAGRFCAVKTELPIETEILISDYLPQVGKILQCSTQMVVLQTKLQPGRLLLDGYLRCTVYYQGEGEAGLCQTEQKLPFTRTLEVPCEDCAAWSAAVGGEQAYLNCRAVHPRRLEVRGAWAVSATLFPQTQQEVVCAVAGADTAQRQTTVKGLRSVGSLDKLVTADCDFAFDTQPGAVLDVSGTAHIHDQQLMQGRLAAKGEITAQLAYRVDGSEKLAAQRVTIPFLQVMELEELGEDCICVCVAQPVGFAVQNQPDSGGNSRLTASVQLHLRAYRPFSVDVVGECFSTRYLLDTVPQPLVTEQLAAVLDTHETVAARAPIPGEGVQILSCLAAPGSPEILTGPGTASLRVRPRLSVLYKNALDELDCTEAAAELVLPLDVPSPAEGPLHAEVWVSVESMNCIPAGDGAELSASLHIEGLVLRQESQTVLTGVEQGPPRPPRDPDIVLHACYVQPGEQVFDVARRFHVLPGQILAANGLTPEDGLPSPGSCLLIPCAQSEGGV